MKREAIGHTKMKRLCRRLDIPQWQGVGLLESIWHLTAGEAPRGDIGKLSDEDVALAIRRRRRPEMPDEIEVPVYVDAENIRVSGAEVSLSSGDGRPVITTSLATPTVLLGGRLGHLRS